MEDFAEEDEADLGRVNTKVMARNRRRNDMEWKKVSFFGGGGGNSEMLRLVGIWKGLAPMVHFGLPRQHTFSMH